MSFNGSGVFNINTAGQPVVSGTVITATAFNALTADLATGLSTCLTKDGQTNPTANLPMANYKFTGMGAGSDAADSANLSQVQSTVVKLIGSVSGTDTITGSLTPALTAYAAGQMFYFVAAGDNTGAVTLNINSLGAKNVTKNGTTALAAGEIKSGQTVAVIYDGTRFQVVGGAGLTGFTDTNNTALGVNAADSLTTGSANTAIGYNAGTDLTSGFGNTFVGEYAGENVTTGQTNVCLGRFAGGATTTQSGNTYVGHGAGLYRTAANNTAVGYQALLGAIGNGSGYSNTAVGTSALESVTTGYKNTSLGNGSGYYVTTGYENVFVGMAAGQSVTSNYRNTAVGYEAYYASSNYLNSACFGYNSQVTGSNQVQLGDSNTTTYAYGAVQDRSDARDKADIQTTDLGLAFVMALQPRKYRWDMREDYRPPKPADDASDDEWNAWREACKLSNLTHDGTHKRNRFHHGLVAQEVKSVMDSMGVDFGGYQDHTINGGDAVLTIGYEEMIAPLIKAIQELKAEFDAYKATHP